MPIDKRVEVCLLATFAILLFFVIALSYALGWTLYAVAKIAYSNLKVTSLIVSILCGLHLIWRIFRYICKLKRERSDVERTPRIDFCIKSLRKKVSFLLKRAVEYSNNKKNKMRMYYKLSAQMLKLVLIGIDLVKTQKANLKKLREIKQDQKRHEEYLEEKLKEKAMRDTSHLLKHKFESPEDGQQEIEKRLCIFDQRGQEFFFKQRKIFKMKPAEQAKRKKHKKRRNRTKCGKPSTYFPYRCNIATVLHAIERVDEAYVMNKDHFNMVKKVEKALSHFLCVITDILVRIDPEKVSKQAYLSNKPATYITSFEIPRNNTREKIRKSHIHCLIVTTNARLMAHKDTIVQILDEKNSKDIMIDNKSYMEIVNFTNKLRYHIVPELRKYIDDVMSRLEREEARKKEEAKRKKEEAKRKEEEVRQFVDEITKRAKAEEARRCAEREKYWVKMNYDLAEEPTRLPRKSRSRRLPDRKTIEDNVYLAAGWVGLGLAAGYVISYFIR